MFLQKSGPLYNCSIGSILVINNCDKAEIFLKWVANIHMITYKGKLMYDIVMKGIDNDFKNIYDIL